ncbi:PadR family transcriptional regulator [Streptomyces fagopyri]|uniref:PadR family transcriptional regulator n=1 Tax=Streptomyces fagopyri TaxID=2662397 RepID=UPI003823AE64
MIVRLTRKVRCVALAIHALDQPWALPICTASGLGPAAVYPILDRLTSAGWITSRTEETPPDGRPPRRLYHLTSQGRAHVGIPRNS